MLQASRSELTDPSCRHLYSLQLTADGNFKLGQYMKNNDPDDVSLSAGNGYFPPDSIYIEYLKKLVLIDEVSQAGVPSKLLILTSWQKTVCNYINAVMHQNMKLFKWLRITGLVNIQCAHVFVLSTVDLQYGERSVPISHRYIPIHSTCPARFGNVDFGLARALLMVLPWGRRMETLREIIGDFDADEPMPDVYLSYDAGCAYCVNLESRFAEAWPELADVVKKIHICIPALHIQNHQEKCMYWFSTAYLECVGHFHGRLQNTNTLSSTNLRLR